jgi:hypothetical protein
VPIKGTRLALCEHGEQLPPGVDVQYCSLDGYEYPKTIYQFLPLICPTGSETLHLGADNGRLVQGAPIYFICMNKKVQRWRQLIIGMTQCCTWLRQIGIVPIAIIEL